MSITHMLIGDCRPYLTVFNKQPNESHQQKNQTNNQEGILGHCCLHSILLVAVRCFLWSVK
jgi:hypothetical protein